MKHYYLFTGLFLICWCNAHAQDDAPATLLSAGFGHVSIADTTASDIHLSNLFYTSEEGGTNIFRSQGAKFAIPAVCITYGLIARDNNSPIRRFDRYIGNQVDEHIKHPFRIDDYLQYMPAVTAYGLDFLPAISAKHNFRDRTLVMATSYLTTLIIVQSVKYQVDETRPNGHGYSSFPSGHTAVAFTGAHILYKEYKDQSPWIGIGGYAAATATGIFRITNKAHWVNDVVTGAGIGLLSAEVGYMMLPVWHKLFGIQENKSQMVIMPAASSRSVGVGMVYIF